jgi:signal transduction histidine kinase/CheY-like chemotaxis protein
MERHIFNLPLTKWLFGLLLCLCLGKNSEASPEVAVSQKGVLDLRNHLPTDSHILLDGEWKLYWHRLLTRPDTTAEYAFVTYPALWSDLKWKGKPLPMQGYGTYELTILMPAKRAELLSLTMPDVYSAYHLYLNGQLAAANGTPGTTAETTTPYWAPRLVPLPANADTVRVLLQMANFHHSKGGPYKSISLGASEYQQASQRFNFALDTFLAGCLLMGGLFFLGLYQFGYHDRTNLFFSLFAILYSYRIVGSRQYVLHSLFPRLNWHLTLHLEYLTLFLSVAMFILYTRELYPLPRHRRMMLLLAGVISLFAVVTLLLPPVYFTQLITPFMIVMALGTPYAFFIYWTKAGIHLPSARFSLMSIAVLLVIFVAIIMEYYRMASFQKLFMFFGYLSFFFLLSLIVSFRFATALKKAKEQAESGLKTKGEFLSTMSHEIRTPLNSVVGATHLLLRDGPRPDQVQHLNVLLFSANNLLTIVNDILDLNKIEAGKVSFVTEPINVDSIGRNTINSFSKMARDSGIELKLVVDPALTKQVIGDHTRMSQVLGNLVHNAIKFTPRGLVTLRMEVKEQTQNYMTITFSVEDTGIGIPPDKQKAIFERFTQVDSSTARGYTGTGLGLAITKQLLELQKVALCLTSQEGVGSTFYFTQTFPLAPESLPAQTVHTPVLRPDKPLENVHVLVVDDNPMNILVAQNFLKRWGAHAETAQNGKEAVEKLDSTRHQLILMDLHMPVMDGYEATQLLRKRGETVPIVALTASIGQEVEGRVYSLGFDDILVKPFNPHDLLRVVQEQVQRTRQL